MENTAERLDYYRKTKGLTYNSVASVLGLTEGAIRNAIKRNAVKLSHINELCTYYGINKQWLLEGVGNMEDYPNRNTQIEAKDLDNDTTSIMFVPLVNNYAYGGYMNGYADEEYIESLSKIPFIMDKEYKGQYLCFEVKGDSMECDNEESIPEGSILLCRNVRNDYWKSKLHINKWDFVIVHREKGIVVKRIINHDVENGKLTLHSLNDFYSDYIIDLKDVTQIFNIVQVQTKRKRR